MAQERIKIISGTPRSHSEESGDVTAPRPPAANQRVPLFPTQVVRVCESEASRHLLPDAVTKIWAVVYVTGGSHSAHWNGGGCIALYLSISISISLPAINSCFGFWFPLKNPDGINLHFRLFLESVATSSRLQHQTASLVAARLVALACFSFPSYHFKRSSMLCVAQHVSYDTDQLHGEAANSKQPWNSVAHWTTILAKSANFPT